MQVLKRFTPLAAAMIGALMAAPVAAQEPADPPAQTQSDIQYSNEKLAAFAEAATEVNKVMFAWRGRMQQAQDEQAQQEMLQKANEEIVAIVQATPNITMQEYQEIATAAGQNQTLADDLRERVREQMESEQESGTQ